MGSTDHGSAGDIATTWIIVPALNEAGVIGRVVSDLRSRYPNIVVVDDGSSDSTGRVARKAGASVVRHLVNLGQGAALQTGIRYALERGARTLITFDADAQHDVEDVAALLDALVATGADVALGSRFLRTESGIPWRRRAVLRAAVTFTRFVTGLPVSDTHNGLRAFTSSSAEILDIRMNGMAHASEILDEIARRRLRWVEVPVTVHYTEYSRAKGQRSWRALFILFDYLVGRISR